MQCRMYERLNKKELAGVYKFEQSFAKIPGETNTQTASIS